MKRPSQTISLLAFLSLGLLGAACALAYAAPLFAPQPGLLVLKNGQVLSGAILREGDRYIIALGEQGERGELRIPVGDVEFTCRDIHEAYQRKRLLITRRDVKPHVDLADWCVRQGLLDRAADEIVAALAIDPTDERIAAVEQKLKVAATPRRDEIRPLTQPPPSQEEIATAVKMLAPEAVEQFTTHVQPLLLNRCGATACHGPSSSSTLRLVRAPVKHVNTLRETQRNLFSVLALVKAEGESPLLTAPLAPHGSAKTAVLDEHDRRQIDMLRAWIDLVRRTSAAAPSAQASRRPATVSRANYEEAIQSAGQGVRRADFEEPMSADSAGSARAGSAPRGAAAGDPFDPALFNQQPRKAPGTNRPR